MTRLRVYGDMLSGNCYKVALLLSHLGRDHDWVHVDILRGGTRTPEFLAMNPNGKLPLLDLGDGRHLAESNAILHYLGDGRALLPTDSRKATSTETAVSVSHEHIGVRT